MAKSCFFRISERNREGYCRLWLVMMFLSRAIYRPWRSWHVHRLCFISPADRLAAISVSFPLYSFSSLGIQPFTWIISYSSSYSFEVLYCATYARVILLLIQCIRAKMGPQSLRLARSALSIPRQLYVLGSQTNIPFGHVVLIKCCYRSHAKVCPIPSAFRNTHRI